MYSPAPTISERIAEGIVALSKGIDRQGDLKLLLETFGTSFTRQVTLDSAKTRGVLG